MQNRAVRLIALLLMLSLVVSGSWAVAASSGGPYELSWFTMDGGGTMGGSGGSLTLGATVAQPDAAASDGGTYALQGGFWGVTQVNGYHLYLPLAVR